MRGIKISVTSVTKAEKNVTLQMFGACCVTSVTHTIYIVCHVTTCCHAKESRESR